MGLSADGCTPGPVEASRGLLHGAMALYLTRYLNVPPPTKLDAAGVFGGVGT